MAMTKAMKLSTTDFRIGLFVGILSKKRSKKKLTKNPIIRPTSKPPTQTVSMLEIDSAALYSAAMGSQGNCEGNCKEG